MVTNLKEERPHILKDVKKAEANGLHITQRTRYIECALLNELHGLRGIATMMLPGYDWEDYLETLLADPDVIRVGTGEDPPATTSSKPPAKPAKKEGAPMSKVPAGEENVTAKEGDAARREVRKLAESMGYELTETGGAVTCTDGDDEIAKCTYKRGTKNGAWKSVFEQLEVLM
jgi:hypothetical protein